MQPNIKFGDIMVYSEEWFLQSGNKKRNPARRFVATGKIDGEEPDWLVYVVEKNKSYVRSFHHTFLKKREFWQLGRRVR